MSTEKKRRLRLGWLLAACLILPLLVVLVVLGIGSKPARPPGPTAEVPLAELPLADGRTFQIEAVTFGTEHVVGPSSAALDRFGSVLPPALVTALRPDRPRNRFTTSHPSLVVWVNALDPVACTNVDCQAVRVELGSGENGWFGEQTRAWFGGTDFWRVGHVFSVYPRHLTNLTVRITPWKTNVSAQANIPNPSVVTPEAWTGRPVPQEHQAGPFVLRLAAVTLRTNHVHPQYYQTATTFWDPTWEILANGAPAEGWQEPVWVTEDATGNRGIHLGSAPSVLRFSVICYPSSTNEAVAELVARLPTVNLAILGSNMVVNQTLASPVGDVRFVGLFPPSLTLAYVFADGEYLPAPPYAMGGVYLGGAPSGWTKSGGFANPLQEKWHHGHYTPWPTFYLHADLKHTTVRFGIRLRNADGRVVATRMEPQGARAGIWPYLATNATNLTVVTPEIVLLRPLEATFDVDTTSLSREPGPHTSADGVQQPSETAVDLFD